jgi:hypothetical protein
MAGIGQIVESPKSHLFDQPRGRQIPSCYSAIEGAYTAGMDQCPLRTRSGHRGILSRPDTITSSLTTCQCNLS